MQELISAYGPRFLVAALGVSLALLCLFIVLWILRNRAPSPFVRGGRNRQPRLQVLDAAAVDTRRRIVLIRRDNVEHLVMIGGPTDIVIESGIGDERPYLSARAVAAPILEEPQSLASQAEQASLPKAEAASPQIAASTPKDVTTADPVFARPSLQEPVKEESSSQSVRAPQTAAAAPAPLQRPVSAPLRPANAPFEKPRTAPAAAAPVATVAVAAPIAAPAVAQPTALPATETAPADVRAVEPVSKQEPIAAQTITPDPVTIKPVATPEPVRVAAPAAPQQIAAPANDELELSLTTPPVEPAKAIEPSDIDAFRAEQVTAAAITTHAPLTETSPSTKLGQVTAFTPVIDPPAAEDLLEAARQRVLVPAPSAAPADIRPFEPQRFESAAPAPQALKAPEPPARDMSDFERVLEEEMALHLAADPAPVQRPAAQLPPILPETRADRPRPPVAAILPEANRPVAGQPQSQEPQEPNLQTEIARIFGEMSASRTP